MEKIIIIVAVVGILAYFLFFRKKKGKKKSSSSSSSTAPKPSRVCGRCTYCKKILDEHGDYSYCKCTSLLSFSSDKEVSPYDEACQYYNDGNYTIFTK